MHWVGIVSHSIAWRFVQRKAAWELYIAGSMYMGRSKHQVSVRKMLYDR